MPDNNISYPLNSAEICTKFVETLQNTKHSHDVLNAVVRYFVPSIQGPIPSVKRSISITSEDIRAALIFLEKVSLDTLSSAPDLVSKYFDELNYSATQRTRIRHNLREIIDWARKHGYLPEQNSLISIDVCKSIAVGLFKEMALRPANSRQIVEKFLEQFEAPTDKSDTINGIIRFFVPGCKGPKPYHKPALEIEEQIAFLYLETVPLEYLNQAPLIATSVMKLLGLSRAHQTLVRKSLNRLVNWARAELYLPDPNTVAPWGGLAPSQVDLNTQQKTHLNQHTLLTFYQDYYQKLEESDRALEAKSLQSIVIRYLVPAYKGPAPKSKRITPEELQLGLEYLETIPLNRFNEALDLLDVQLDCPHIANKTKASIRSRVQGWQNWFAKHQKPDLEEQGQGTKPSFRTFYTPGKLRQWKKPGRKMSQERCPTHALCAKEFPDDYINPRLQQQLDAYPKWREANDVRKQSAATELTQIYQVLGWLHRYEGVALENLCFESLIAKIKLKFYISDYRDYTEYLTKKEVSSREISSISDQDIQRVERYLKFVGKSPSSQSRRLFIIILIAKFLYQDLIGTDDFPEARDVPVLRRLLNYQGSLNKKSKTVLETIPYSETSISWEDAIGAMEKERCRADLITVHIERKKLHKGYAEQRRPDSDIADDLQRFLSLALLLLIPSRPRTFYELQIGKTFKEGVLGRRFQSIEEIESSGLRDQLKDQIRFYIHHLPDDYKSGKSMSPALKNSGGWWVEVPNLKFGETCLYDYIYRWLNWGREINGEVNHSFFFRRCSEIKPIDGGAWNHRIKKIFERWTGIPVPPKNVRKMFTTEFPEHTEAGALLLQHTEKAHKQSYDMRVSIRKMRPILEANVHLIESVLKDL